jgi:hypothetical protein
MSKLTDIAAKAMANIKARFSHPDPMAMAHDLIKGGLIVDASGREADDPRFKAFIHALERFARRYDFAEGILALDMMADQGSAAALDFRQKRGAKLMGYTYLHQSEYIPYVIEYGLSYMKGDEGCFQEIAKYAEQRKHSHEAEGVAHAINYLISLPAGPEGEYKLFCLIRDTVLNKAKYATGCQWEENPEIAQLLRGDLNMYRAYVLAHTGRRQEAYERYSAGLEAGLSPRIERDKYFNSIFSQKNAHSEPETGL